MKTNTDTLSLYHQDFYSWIYHNIELLRQNKFAEIDVETLIEELESMAKGKQRELRNYLVILTAYLLKWQFQSNYRDNNWYSIMVEQRYQLLKQLDESPSLKFYFSEALQEAYPDAIKIAGKETGLLQTTFPESCPYSMAQLLDEDFYAETH